MSEEKLTTKQKIEQTEFAQWQKMEKSGKWIYAVKKAVVFSVLYTILIFGFTKLTENEESSFSWGRNLTMFVIIFVIWLALSIFDYKNKEKKFRSYTKE
jgi:hypothetical protein